MPDLDIHIDPTLPLADQAVTYLLNRIQRDPDLRHYMLHIEAFGLLIEAEAARLGRPVLQGGC